MKITKETKIKEIIGVCPEAAEIFMKHGLPCAYCPYGLKHALKDVQEKRGLSDEEVKEILDEINEKIKK